MKKTLLRFAYRSYRVQRRLRRPILQGVRILLLHEEKVVLVYHTYQSGWFLPGGGVKRGETLMEAAMREANEESGARFFGLPRLLGVYTNFKDGVSDHIAVFTCDAFVRATPTDRWEISKVRDFALTDLPDDISPGCHRRILDHSAGNGPYAGIW